MFNDRVLEKLGPYARDALSKASELCIEQTGFEVKISHLLLAMCQQVGGDTAKIFRSLDIPEDEFEKGVRASFLHDRCGAQELPVFSPTLLELLRDSVMVATVELGDSTVRTGAVLVALVKNDARYSEVSYFKCFEGYEALKSIDKLPSLTRGSMENSDHQSDGVSERGRSFLERFGRDITAEAEAHLIDSVLCRDREIRLVVEVLCRRKKNNPILVGEPGVGKTALAEGLAIRFALDQVPDSLKGARLWELDLGSLQAGASVRGEFEKRLRAIFEEVSSSSQNIVLFIDEAHTLIGAGAPSGSGDAANLLKPALSRGALKVIAATTWGEYKKYFEKDAALSRRFQMIRVNEPTPKQTSFILRGLRRTFEELHKVYISDAGLEAAVNLSYRYFSGRHLPDKAIDVLDAACVRVANAKVTQPLRLDHLHQQVHEIQQVRWGLVRDSELGAAGYLYGHDASSVKEAYVKLDDEISELELEIERLDRQWQAEKSMASEIEASRRAICSKHVPDIATEPMNCDNEVCSQSAIEELATSFQKKGHVTPTLVPFEVGEEVIAQVVSDWTGVPSSVLSVDETTKLSLLGDRLRAEVLGQEEPLTQLHERLMSARLDLVREDMPRGVFLLAGPSGVGKTQTAHVTAEILFGGRQFLTVVNMSEYQEKHSVSRLIGSPPGYVGFGEGGILTEALRKAPHSVVLLDEVEKAHPDVLNTFLQVFDKGVLNDGEGRLVDCSNAIFFMTSNKGAATLFNKQEYLGQSGQDELRSTIWLDLEAHFSTAFLARTCVLVYQPLDREIMKQIIVRCLNEHALRLRNVNGTHMTWDDDAVTLIARLCNSTQFGARMVEQIIERWILSRIAKETLSRMAANVKFNRIQLSACEGTFEFRYEPNFRRDVA